MLTVEVLINGKKILEKNVVNISDKTGQKYGKGNQTYKIMGTKNTYIKHKFEKGAVNLAIKVLELYKGGKNNIEEYKNNSKNSKNDD